MSDALLTLRAAVGKISLDSSSADCCDVDGSGDVTVSDALRILQKAVGKIESFPAEKQFPPQNPNIKKTKQALR